MSEWTLQFWRSCWAECRPGEDHTVPTISLLLFLQQNLHSLLLLNIHFQTSVERAGEKCILPMKFKAKCANNCFAGLAVRYMYCTYYVIILLNKAKGENFLFYIPSWLWQRWPEQVVFVHPFHCLESGNNEASFVKDSELSLKSSD